MLRSVRSQKSKEETERPFFFFLDFGAECRLGPWKFPKEKKKWNE